MDLLDRSFSCVHFVVVPCRAKILQARMHKNLRLKYKRLAKYIKVSYLQFAQKEENNYYSRYINYEKKSIGKRIR